MPKLEDFPKKFGGYSCSMYELALKAWEKVCQMIIEQGEVS